MDYPHLPPQKDRRRKLMPEDIDEIRTLFKGGMVRIAIANKFSVSESTIVYWTDEAFRQRQNENSSKNHMRLMENDPAYRDRQKKSHKASREYAFKIIPKEMRKYRSVTILAWRRTPKGKALVSRVNKTFRKNHLEEITAYNRKYHREHHDELIEKQRVRSRRPEAVKARKESWAAIKADPAAKAEKNRRWNEWAKRTGWHEKKKNRQMGKKK
jgi:hypothetical protein